MARFKPYSYSQKLMIRIDLNEQLQPGTFEFALNQIVDELDLSVFDHRFHNDETGAPAYDPAIMLRIVLFAYSRGITSSRQIARACRENVVFMALAADSHPHFTTIADFISSMTEEITPLFRNVLLICSQEGLIGKEMFAIDGCKISSNCAKEWSGTRADFQRRSEKLDRSITFLLEKHRETDCEQEKAPHDDDASGPAGNQRQKEERAIKRLRAHKEKLDAWLAVNEDRLGATGKPKQSNITDNESAKMPTSHGVVQGYNGLAAVDSRHQVIIHAEAFGEGSEKHLLEPMLTGMRENFHGIGDEAEDPLREAVLVADNGYHSEDNVRLVFEQGLDAYLPDAHFRKRNPALAGEQQRYKRPIDRKGTVPGKKYFSVSDFHYDEAKGKMICPAGKEMYIRNRNFWTAQGRRGITYMAKKTDCRVCSLRQQCLRRGATVARQVTVFAEKEASYTKKMIERFDSALGQFLYSRRMGIVEPVFANVCCALGLDWFSLRGKAKVDTQWKLFAIVHDLLKLARYGPSYAVR